MERKQKRFNWITFLTILLTLFPFGEALFSGGAVLAATATDKTTHTVFQNEAGNARITYSVDEKNKEIQWLIDYNKAASELPRAIGFSLKSGNEEVTPTAIQSNAGDIFTYAAGFLQTAAEKTAQLGYQVAFTTPYRHQLTITPQILAYDLKGGKTDLLAQTTPLTVTLPALSAKKETQSTSKPAEKGNENNSTRSNAKNQVLQRATARTKEKGNEANLVDLDTGNFLGDNQTILLNATLKDDQNQEIKDGDSIVIGQNILLEYNWQLPEGLRKEMLGYTANAGDNDFQGDYFTFKLPENFHIHPTTADQTISGELKDGQGICFGHFNIQADGTVTLHFSDNIEGRNDISGTFYVAGTVSDVKGNTTGNVEVKVPFVQEDSDTTVHIEEPDYKALEKTVGKVSYGSSEKANVTWTIIGNKYGTEMTAGKITDTLPEHLTWTKITVYEYDVADVKPDGTLNGTGKDVTKSVVIGSDKTKVAVDLPTPTSKVYKVVVATEIDLTKLSLDKVVSTDGKKVTYTSPDIKNEAHLTAKEGLDLTAVASTTVVGSATVTKSYVEQYGEIINWNIVYKQKDASLPAVDIYELPDGNQDFCTKDGTPITTAKQLQDYLQEITVPKTQVTVRQDAGKYVITIPKGTKGQVSIPIYTKLKTGATETSVANTASFTDNSGSKGTHHLTSGVVKEVNGKAVDFTNKTIPWAITINKKRSGKNDAIKLDKWSITDTLQNDMYIPASTAADLKGKITVTRYDKNNELVGSFTNFTVTIDEKNVNGVTKFTVSSTLEKASDDYFIIRFKSNYETLADTMVNQVVYNYSSNGVEGQQNGEGKYEHKSYYNIDLDKAGTYRYDKNTKKHYVNWGVTINAQGHYYGEDAQVVDVLNPGQTYVDNSFKVYVKKGDNFEEVTENPPLKLQNDNGKLTITGFKAGEQTIYKVTFDVVVKDLENESNIPSGIVKNTVQYSDRNNAEIKKDAQLSLDNNKAYVTKEKNAAGVVTNDPDYPGKKITAYQVTVNPAGFILYNVNVADEPNEFLNLIPASFKIMDDNYELKLNQDYTGSVTPRGYIITLTGPYEKLEKTLQITYKAEVNPIGQPGKEIQLKNTVKVTGDNITQKEITDTTEDKFKISDAGGTAQGVTHKITLHKEDQHSQAALENVRFDLYRKGSDEAIDTKQTDISGNLTFEGLTYGEYIIKEGQALSGYYISPELKAGISVVIKENGNSQAQTISLSYTNEQVGNLKLIKSDAETKDKKLAGAVFALYHADEKGNATTQVTEDAHGKKLGATDTHYFTTQNDGTILVENLLPGKYIFKEITAPTGYELPQDLYSTVAQVKADATQTATVTKTNEVLKGTIQLKKVAEKTLTALQGAEFTLTSEPLQTPVVKTSEADGSFSFDLAYGYTYTITETKNPNGYKGDFVLTQIALNEQGKVTVAGKELTDAVYSVTNKLITTEIAGTKTWNLKGNDEAGVMPNEITIQLERKQANTPDANYQIVDEVKTNATKGWHYQFSNLPVYDVDAAAGVKFSYRIKEAPLAGFDSQVTGTSLTNTLKTQNISGEKTWDDLAKKYAVIPTSITVNLEVSCDNGKNWQAFRRNQVPVKAVVTAPKWAYSFTDLPLYDEQENRLTYRVKEDVPTGFVSHANEYNLHNEMETTEVNVDKIWLDQSDHYGMRPDGLDFTLKVKVEKQWVDFEDVFKVDKKITLHSSDSDNIWRGTFTDLPKYDAAGSLIQYGVAEKLVVIKEAYTPQDEEAGADHYVKEVAENGRVTFTNCLREISVSVTKQWQDFDNQFESRPEIVTFELQSWPEGTPEALAQVVKTPTNKTGRYQLSGPDYGTVTVSGLPKADHTQKTLHYKFVEVKTAANYEAVTNFSADGSQVITNQLITTSVAGKKTWQDANDAAKARPTQIKVQLLQNGQALSGAAYRKIVTAANDWRYEFSDLPKFDQNGKAYVYSVKELDIPTGYEAIVKDMDITNYLQKVTYNVQKVWVDNNASSRPDKISVALTANDQVVATAVLSADNSWQYTWEQMPQIDENNQVINYQVVEVEVPNGYGVTYAQHGNDFVVTNTLLTTPVVPNTPVIPTTPTTPTNTPTTSLRARLPQTAGTLSDTTSTTTRRRLPNTGSKNTALPFYGLLVLLSVAACGWFVYRRKI